MVARYAAENIKTVHIPELISYVPRRHRPSRDNDPWGDVVEAAAAGVPVIASGDFEGDIPYGVGEFVMEAFDAEIVASHLVALATDSGLWRRMSYADREKGRRQFSGDKRAATAMRVFEALLVESDGAPCRM